MDVAALRSSFPVLERVAYLNAGTDGPVPALAVRSARFELDREARDGRAGAHWERLGELATARRAAAARVLGCEPADLALTTCTTEGLATILAGLDLRPGDEIVTSDEEHPGLLAPLALARQRAGVRIRVVPLAEVASAVGAGTRLVACSHVSWVSGAFAPPELAQLDVPVVLDGAQGAGAVPVDVAELGCAAYAASGQKWLCGPDGTGYLYVAPALRERIAPLAPGYASLVDPARGLDVDLRADARRYDAPATPAEAHAFALASLTVLEAATWPLVHARAAELAARLAELLRERGREVVPRGATTLVAWRSDAAAAEKAGLAGRDVVVRDLPGRGLLRASVGAWNDERDLERLLEALPA